MQKPAMFFAVRACFLAAVIAGTLAGTIEEKIRNDPDLSEFLALMERAEIANVTLQYKQATIFAPINQAFQTYGKTVEDPISLVLYHMASVPKKINQLGSSYTSVYSELTGNPPLWITHTTGSYHNDIYVNNARLLVSQSDVVTIHKDTNLQILHKIDEVLVPTTGPKNLAKIYNPTAFEFLHFYESFIVNPHRLRTFRQKVEQTKKEDIFKTEGGHTFFIPVDEGFVKNERAALIDGKIIDGHVIPKKVLFTAPTKKDVPFETLANGDNNVRVVISFTQENRGPNNIINYVKSHTLLSDGHHQQGVVLSEIVQANIPVKNGVVHLIQRPLMVVDNNVRELLEVHTQDPTTDLYFNVVTSGTNRTVTVEGGGVNATVIQPDLAATNGVIHIIDRVLGVPYTTVYDKLLTDYSLNKTFRLGNQGGFNNQLTDTTKKFTYFVPRNEAWDEAGVDHPSAVKKLFMPQYHYHANNILERHLVISDEPYTMERIKQLTSERNEDMYGPRTEISLPTVRGELSLYVEESNDHTYIIHWKGERIPVFRPNVACTNGVIHVIDAPFLQDGDVQVSKAAALDFAGHLMMVMAAKWLLL
ncbi:fasciclin-1 isoform X3 [Zophobas morio]|uniref:fasciclin-1 isoform X3 n=1 Tax=Zophobas morio TaxID=2755281 RepID=UPI003082E27E